MLIGQIAVRFETIASHIVKIKSMILMVEIIDPADEMMFHVV